MKVTVVIRTYNRTDFLKQCLASVKLQTHTDWEVLIFDDGGSDANFEIYNKFKAENSDKRIVYLTTHTAYELFCNSWLLAPNLATGDIMVRLDDDDLLAEDCLSYISDLYERNEDLDFTYGTAVTFDGDNLMTMMDTMNPQEAPKTQTAWAGYTIPNNHPWRDPFCWYENYYEEPQPFTSIIHCSKSNIMCIYHLYSMRTESVRRVKDKITVTSKYVDDLEFLGSLDYLGLTHTSIHKILSYVREHDTGRVSDRGKLTDGTTLWDDILRIRDKVDYLRPAGFQSRVIPINATNNTNNGITYELQNTFSHYYSRIKFKSLVY